MKKIKDSKIYKTFHKFFYVIEFILAVIVTWLGFLNFYDYMYYSKVNIFKVVICLLIIIVLLWMIIKKIKREYNCYEKIFLTLMIPIGMLYLVFVLPGHVPDESNHVKRITDISQGNLIMDIKEQKQYIPRQIVNQAIVVSNYDELFDKVSVKYDYKSIDKKGQFNHFASYFPTFYLPASLVFKTGINYNLNLFVIIYLARICNFIISLILGYWTIKLIPFGKLLMFTYFFNPMYIQQAISLSVDSLLNASIILFIVYTLYLAYKEQKLSLTDKIIYPILLSCACLNKTVYYPIALICLLLVFDKTKRKDIKERQFIMGCLIFLTLVAIAWFFFSRNYVDIKEYTITHNINPSKQMTYILNHPLSYIHMLIKTIMIKGGTWIYHFFGLSLGSKEVLTPRIGCIILAILMLCAPFLEKNETKSLNNKTKIFLLFLTFVLGILIITALYIVNSPVAFDVAAGIQGRYFLPVVILALLCLFKTNMYKEFKYTKLVYLGIIILLNMTSLCCIIKSFI